MGVDLVSPIVTAIKRPPVKTSNVTARKVTKEMATSALVRFVTEVPQLKEHIPKFAICLLLDFT